MAISKITGSALGKDVIMKDVATADGSSPTLTLQTGDTDIAADDVLGSINFQAPDEGAGTDAILVAAGISAVSEGNFSSSNNATKLVFKTGASETAASKMVLSSVGALTVDGNLVSAGIVQAGGGNAPTKGFQLPRVNGTLTPRITNDASDQTCIRPGVSGGNVAFNNFANSAGNMTIADAGDMKIERGDIFFGTSGKGIVLGATSNTAANTLDDYEEGAVSVLVQGGNGHPNTNVSLTGQYTKVGNMVAFRAQNESLNNTGASGAIYFSGLPFASSGAYGIGTLAWDDLATITGIPYIFISGSIAYVYENRNQADTIAVNHHVDTAGKFYISCVYQTNA